MTEWIFKNSPHLEAKLKKLEKKSPSQFKAAQNKIEEIKRIIPENPQHYKNLRYDLKDYKRVHIDKSFVIIFTVDLTLKKVEFLDLDHHDKIYE